MEQSRTWAECSEAALTGNIRVIKKILGRSKLLGIVKADAYGHGAVQVAKILALEGAEYLAVASIGEAVLLRDAGISLPILVLGPTEASLFDELIEYNLTQTVTDPGFAEHYSNAAKKSGKTLRCHLNIDTGMGWLGFTDLSDAVRAVGSKGLEFEGAFSHFAVSDEHDGAEYTLAQLEQFKAFAREIEQKSGVKFSVLHMANSGGIENFPESHLDMARPGIVLYGYPASGKQITGIKPVMELKSRIVQIKRLKKGDSVSYGRRYIADRSVTIAVVPVGYADGLSRSLSGRMNMIAHGQKAPQIGTICMDMCMIDVTDIPDAKIGSVVTVFGREQGFTARDMAKLRSTIPYEVLCDISGRVPRIWVK